MKEIDRLRAVIKILEADIEQQESLLKQMADALLVTVGNIKSLGPAGAIGLPGREYEEWLSMVEAALVGEK